jgi:transcriptional regulator with XRE-family HTH domain
MLTKQIVKELAAARVRLGLSQQDVADRMGKHRSAVQGIEHHTKEPRLSTLERYAEAIGVHVKVRITKS